MGIGLALGIASVGLSSMASYQQQNQMNTQLKYQAAMNRINSQMETMSAESELRKGEKEQQQIMMKGGRMRGQQKANYAASGVDLHSRSAQNALNSSSIMTEVDRNQAASNALSNAWQHRLKSTDYNNMANIADAQRSSAWGAALGTAVKGAATLGMTYGTDIGSWFNSLGGPEVTDLSSYGNGINDLLTQGATGGTNYGMAAQSYAGTGINSFKGMNPLFNGAGIRTGTTILGQQSNYPWLKRLFKGFNLGWGGF